MSDAAVVIGSGPNGLAAAIRLAEAGLPVTVLEAAAHPGGAVRTEELTLPGYRHDTFSAVHPAGAASPVFLRLPLAEHGLEWVHPQVCMAHVLGDGTAVTLDAELDRTAASLDAQGPGDGARWSAFVAPYLSGFEAVRATMLAGFPPLRGAMGLLESTGAAGLATFARLLTGTAVGLGTRLFTSAGARAWLFGAAMHGDVPPTGAGSAIAGTYLNLLGHAVGWPSPRGGSGRITDALVAHLTALGGRVRTGARADRILVRGGRVSGVAIQGERIPATAVVATVMPRALLAMTGESLSAWYRRALGWYVPGPATVKVDWALGGPIPWTAPEARLAGTVHVGGSDQEILQWVRVAADRLPPRPFLLLGQQSIADPSRAPAGGHTAWAYTHAAQGLASRLGGPEMVEAIEAQVERFAPGFQGLIRARHVLAPADLEARDANLIGGDVGGGSYRLRQAIFRPVPRINPYATPVQGLFLGGAATFPGGAVHGVPGDAAARALLRSLGLRR